MSDKSRSQGAIARLVGVAALILIAGCQDESPQNVTQGPVAATVQLQPTFASVAKYDHVQLTAVVWDSSGQPIADAPIVWSSTNPASATVDATGKITALSEGSTQVTATSGPATGTSQIVVVAPPAASISISPGPVTVPVGSVAQLTATVLDAANQPIVNAAVTWSSGDHTIATVDAQGAVTGVAAGSTTITATSGLVTTSVGATVSGAPGVPSSIGISPSSLSLAVGEHTTVAAVVYDQAGNSIPSATVTWSSADPAIASVASDGTVTGLAAGATRVTAHLGSVSQDLAVTITSTPGTPAALAVLPSSVSLQVRAQARLSATVHDAAGNVLAAAAVTWTTADASIATVRPDGLVTAVAIGSTQVTATSGTVSGAATVNVTLPVAATISMAPNSLALAVGAHQQVVATVKDANGQALAGAPVTWASSAPAVATVQSDGTVTGVAAGTASITATSGAATASITATISAVAIAKVSVTPSQFTVAVGGQQQLAGVPQDATGKAVSGAPVSWSSSNQAVATVQSNGTVTGVAAGAATITATSDTAKGTAKVTVTAATNNSPLHVAFASYLGGSGSDQGRDVTVDAAGNIYIAGSTGSTDFPTTAGVLGPTFHAGGGRLQDAFVTKLSPAGTMTWSTYVGGPWYERAYGIELDPQGAIVIAGRAGAGFPTTPGVFQPNFGGGAGDPHYGDQDGFICKIAPNGSAAQWCSYLGVADDGFIRDVAVDAAGDVYVATMTNKGGFPSSWFTGVVQPTKHAGTDGLIVKVKGDGSRVLWATYLGGNGEDASGPSIRVDPQGNVVVAFATTSTDMPTVNAAFPTNHGRSDFYVAKLSPDGRRLIYASYFGGSGDEVAETHTLWLDSNGDALVSCFSASNDAPTTAGAYQRAYGGGGNDLYVFRLSPTGALKAATYLGGTGDDGAQGIVTDAQGNVIVTGTSNGPFPATVPTSPAGLYDVVVAKLSPDLSQLLYGARFGGAGGESGRGIFVTPAGEVLIVGQTASANFPVLNAFQPLFGGVDEAFVIKLIP